MYPKLGTRMVYAPAETTTPMSPTQLTHPDVNRRRKSNQSFQQSTKREAACTVDYATSALRLARRRLDVELRASVRDRTRPEIVAGI